MSACMAEHSCTHHNRWRNADCVVKKLLKLNIDDGAAEFIKEANNVRSPLNTAHKRTAYTRTYTHSLPLMSLGNLFFYTQTHTTRRENLFWNTIYTYPTRTHTLHTFNLSHHRRLGNHPNLVSMLAICLDPPCIVSEVCAHARTHTPHSSLFFFHTVL